MSSRSIAEITWDPVPALAARAAAWPAPLASGDSDRIEVWGTADELLARHCRSDLSGTLRIDGEPVRLYLQDGLVYFAERTTDPGLVLPRARRCDQRDQLVHGLTAEGAGTWVGCSERPHHTVNSSSTGRRLLRGPWPA
jgi:hypothetical protein